MFLRKLFWNLGGILPVWLVHPGQIILALERWLGATLFKGAQLPAWWTPNIVPGVIASVGAVAALAVAVAGTFLSIEMGKSETVQMWMCIAKFVVGLIIAATVFIMSGSLTTIWPWRYLRVAVVEVNRHHCVCLIGKSPCMFTGRTVDNMPERYLHWFWGPTLGSRDWKFKVRVTGNEEVPNSGTLTVTDKRGGVYEFPITCQMMASPDGSSYVMRQRMLYCVMREKGHHWTTVLHTLFFNEMIEGKDMKLARIEKGAWSSLIGMHLAYYFERGRTTRPDKEIALRLRRMEVDVVYPYMEHVAQRSEGPDHDPAKLETLFKAMDWPSLVSRRKKRLGHHTAHAEPVTDAVFDRDD